MGEAQCTSLHEVCISTGSKSELFWLTISASVLSFSAQRVARHSWYTGDLNVFGASALSLMQRTGENA